MKKILFIACFLFIFSATHGQYYLRGEIRDANNSALSNVKILLHSSAYVYYSGSQGSFGIPLQKPTDSVTFMSDGYEVISVKLDASKYQFITLKLLHPPPPADKKNLLSSVRNLKPEDRTSWSLGGETYNSLVQNDFVATEKFPETEFAVNINKASYSNIRRFLNMGATVPPDAVRIEEMLNYFNFNYTLPLEDSTFTFRSYLSQCPWNENNQLLYLNLCAAKIDLQNVPPANLVFLIDISGSMDLPNRLPLIKSAFRLLVNNLREIDTVSIVVYGSTVGLWLKPTAGNDKEVILKSIEDLSPGGPTPGEAGIHAAYRVAKNQFIRGGNNRVILATDGDFNVGQTTEEELEKLIVLHKQWGIYLTCLGVGMGNYKDSKLQVLAERGSGNFAYLDNEREAE
ncbi:MAG TPA: von Willebrand factor type A domain-containing protein, partial [Puia sp.]|nr:von Willebrand factor type A domain-containing protein [Puia sp.]